MLSFVTLPTPDTLNSSLKEYPAVVKILNEIYQNIPANKKIYNIVQLRNTLQSLNITNEFLTSLIERVNLFVCFCLGCDLTNLTKEINSFIKDFYIGADRITPLYPNSPIAKAINDYHEIYSSKNSKEKPPFKEFRKKYISEAIKKGEIVVQRTNPQINDWVCGTQKYKKANRDEKFLVFPCNSSMYGQGFVHITTGENSELAISSFSSESYHDIRGANGCTMFLLSAENGCFYTGVSREDFKSSPEATSGGLFHSTLSKSNLNPTKNNPPTAISAGLMITNYINKKENKLEELNIIINNSGHFVGNLPSLHLLINQLKFSGVCPKYILMNIRGWPPRAHYLSQEDQCYFDQMQRIYLQGFLVDTDRLLNKFDNIENIESWGLEQLIETKLRDDFQKAIDKTNIEPHFLEEKIKLFRQDRKSLPTTEEDIHNFTFRLKLLLFVIQVKKGDIKLIGQLKEYTELTHQGILPFCTDEEFLRLKINAINELAKQDSYLLGFNKQQTQQFGYQPEGLQLTW